MKMNFWTPIKFENGPRSQREKWIEKVDSYFSLQGRKAVVLNFGNRDRVVHQRDRVVHQKAQTNYLKTALKVISYATVIFPLIALTAKYFLRKNLVFTQITEADLRSEDQKIINQATAQYYEEKVLYRTFYKNVGDQEQLNKIGTIYQNVQIFIAGSEKIAETKKAVEKQGSIVARKVGDQASSFASGFVTEAFTQAVPAPLQLFAKPVFSFVFSSAADATKGIRHEATESLVKDSPLITNTAKHAAFMKARNELADQDANTIIHSKLAPLYPSPQENQNLRYNGGFNPTSSSIYNNLYKTVYEKALFQAENQPFHLDMPSPESVFEEPKFKQNYPNFPNLAIVKEALEMEDLSIPYYSNTGFVANAPGTITTFVSSFFS